MIAILSLSLWFLRLLTWKASASLKSGKSRLMMEAQPLAEQSNDERPADSRGYLVDVLGGGAAGDAAGFAADGAGPL